MKKLLEKLRFAIAHRLDKSSKFCWADLALFGMGFNMWHNLTNKRGNRCKFDSIEEETCYCGKFYKGRLATKDDYKEVNNGPETDQFKPKWIDMPVKTNPDECNRIVVLFDNGDMKFYNDEEWPFALVVGVFILPEKPTLNRNQPN
jgi:hypothetical protein